nr:hypothetical protein B0A51_08666 [Rachicladosporium sp. CCFEE 5018]
MATPDERLNAQFAASYNDLLQLYDAGGVENLLACISGARKLLGEPVIPLYHEMKTLLLLAATVADPDEAWLFYQQALIKWQVIRSCSPKGHDDRIDEPMSELEESMEEVKGVLVAELADLYDVPGDDFEAEEDEIINAALERQAEQFREAKLDAEALLQADKKALGKTREEILEFDASKKAAKNNNCAEPRKDDSIDKPLSGIDDLLAKLKRVDKLVHAPEPALDVSDFHSKNGHHPVLTRAKSERKMTARGARNTAPVKRVGDVASLVAMFDKPTEENKPPTVLPQYRSERLDEPHGGSEKKDDGGNARKEQSEGGHRNSVRLSD